MKRILIVLSLTLLAAMLLFSAACSSAKKADRPAAGKIPLKKIETGKKILVVYYSKTGNTERVALDVASSLGAVLEKLQDKKERAGCINWFLAGKDGMRENETEIEPVKIDAAGYDLVILGSPVWGWNMTPAIRTYIVKNKAKFRDVAFFITSGNTHEDKMVPYLEKIIGKKAAAYTGFSAKELADDNVYGHKITKFIDSFAKKDK